jgi:chloride channel 7
MVDGNRHITQYIIDKYHHNTTLEIVLPLVQYCSIAAFYGLIAGLLTVYYGPGANGSGVAEMIGYMNGINYPDFIGFNTLITKIFGVTLAVSGRLTIGKEGPLAHIGSIMGIAPIYLPFESLKTMQNDHTKRQLIAAGGSAGVAAAFGAPIGGALFAYEMSKPTSFWTFSMIWKTFISCSFAVLTLGAF